MKNFVTGWRRAPSAAGRDAGPKVEREPLPPPLPKPPRTEIVEPSPAPPTRAPRRPSAPRPEPEIIDAPRAPRRPPQPLALPSLRIPANIGQWMMLGVFALMFKLSADATYAAIGGILPSYGWAVAMQAAISCIERFHFAGNKNPFTLGTLVFDTALTATGLGMALLPQFFTTPLYQFVTSDLLGGFGVGGFTGFSLAVMAMVFGFIIAYGGDKVLDLAMGR